MIDGENSVNQKVELMTLKEVCEASKASRATVYRWRHEKGLKMFRCGGAVRVRKSDWLEWLAKHTDTEMREN